MCDSPFSTAAACSSLRSCAVASKSLGLGLSRKACLRSSWDKYLGTNMYKRTISLRLKYAAANFSPGFGPRLKLTASLVLSSNLLLSQPPKRTKRKLSHNFCAIYTSVSGQRRLDSSSQSIMGNLRAFSHSCADCCEANISVA